MSVSTSVATSIVQTVAGTGTPGYSGDGGSPATEAQINFVRGIHVQGDLIWFTDSLNARTRRIIRSVNGITTDVNVSGVPGFSGDGGIFAVAHVSTQIADFIMDGRLSWYIADGANNRVRYVNNPSGIITTIAGNGDPWTHGDGGPATEAGIPMPHALAFDSHGDLYIGESAKVRRIDRATGLISTYAGTGYAGPSGDGGPAVDASLIGVYGLAFDGEDNLYIAEYSRHSVRRVDRSTGLISTLAGTGEAGYSGDGGPCNEAQLNMPTSLAFDWRGNLWIADGQNFRIRRIDWSNGIIDTKVGTGVSGYNGDGQPPEQTWITIPAGLAFDRDTNTLFFSDVVNYRIRAVTNVV